MPRALNPGWTENEVILAYDLMKKIGPADDRNPDVIELSELLRRMNDPGAQLNETFRNPAGVAMKLLNLHWFDSDGQSGLSGGSRTDSAVVQRFRDDPAGLTARAAELRSGMAQGTGGRRAWLVRAWDGQENHAADFESLGRILVGFRMGDLTGMDREAIRGAVDEVHADRPPQGRMNIASQLNLFVNEMQLGDIVLTPASRDEGEVLVGLLAGPYEYLDSAPLADWRHSHPVGWQGAVMRSELDESITRSMGAPVTIVRLSNVPAAERLLYNDPTLSPLHLILKWRAEDEPRTIELHREVASRSGSVWWGKLGDPNAPRQAMSNRMLARFQGQLESGVSTHVYLYRPGEVWRTSLMDITLDSADTDPALVPTYYGDAQHNLWVRLTDFEALGPAWALTNLEPAGPRASERSMETLLRSRSSVLYVHERISEATVGGEEPITEEPRTRTDLTVDLVRTFAEAKGLILDDSVLESVVAAVHAGKHIVLTGPPGTAKTTLAQAIADAATELGICKGSLLTTATADWTTYETIGGLRPTSSGRLEFAAGHFLDAIKAQRWLVIDELNRSNFDRAFGQLFTVLSGQTVVLPYEDPGSGRRIALVPEGEEPPSDTEPIDIPGSWQVLATMNVFDKSLLFEMSFALMRRFAFIEVPAPADESFLSLIDRESGGSTLAQDVARSLLPLRAIKEMGPALFMDVARFASSHAAITNAEPEDLAFQAFYSYLLPQFEGVDEAQGDALFNALRTTVGAHNRASLKRVLREVLGLELADVRRRAGRASAEEEEEEQIEFETPEDVQDL